MDQASVISKVKRGFYILTVDLAGGGAEEEDVGAAEALVQPAHGVQVEEAVGEGVGEPGALGDARPPGGGQEVVEGDWGLGWVDVWALGPFEDEA